MEKQEGSLEKQSVNRNSRTSMPSDELVNKLLLSASLGSYLLFPYFFPHPSTQPRFPSHNATEETQMKP
jgi:hypothetical protein